MGSRVHGLRRSAVLVLALLVCAPAAAQDADQLVAAGSKHLDAYQYGPALQQYIQIPDTASPERRLDKHLGIGMALMGMSRYTDVMEHITKALELAKEIGTDAALARAKSLEGQYLQGTQSGDRGLAALHLAASLAERGGAAATKSLAAIYGNLANTYVELEDFERQTYYMQKAHDLIPNPTPGQQFNFRISRGIAFFEMYERDTAEAEFNAALELASITKRPRDRGFALGELAFLYETFDRDHARALRLYDEAIEYSRLAKVASQEANWLVNRANIYRETGDYARAERDYRQAIALHDANGTSNQTFHMWKNVGQVMRLMGRTKEGAALLDKLIRERTQDARQRHLWQAHMELASALDTLGDREGARRHFDAMLGVIDEHRNRQILDAFRTGTFAHALNAYDPFDRYIKFNLDQQRSLEALAIAERARARGFLEALGSARGVVATRLPPALLAEESRIARAISAAQLRLRSRSLDQAERNAALAALTAAEQEREKFLLTLRVEHPALAEARYPTFLDIAEIQQSLRPGEVVYSFYLMAHASQRWAITSAGVETTAIAPRAEIESQAQKLIDALRVPGDPAAVRGPADALAALLFVDLAPPASTDPITIVPHGILNYIPFEVLRYGGALLVERHAVSYAASLNALVQLRRAPAQAADFRVLAVGNPSIPGGEAGDRKGDVEHLALLGPLPYAERELRAIGRTFPERTRILSGAFARETDVRSSLTAQFPIVHFATHGLVSDVHPNRSGLLFAPEQGEDGLLQTREIYGLALKADLIVLSACSTALGKEITGEGLVGLSRAFFYAGARSVLATLWNLNDEFASEFIARFYRELNTGISSEEALRRAKAAYVNHPRYGHPFYWSSMVILGDGAIAPVANPVQPAPVQPVLAAVFAALAVGIVLRKATSK